MLTDPVPTSVATRVRRRLRGVRRAVLVRRRLLAAVFAAVAVAAGLQSVSRPPPPTAVVLVAARDLDSGTVLRRGDLVEAEYAPDTVPTRLADDPFGETLAGPLRRGEPVSDLRLVDATLTEGYPGLVAVPVRLPDGAMVELLQVGDRIDLVAADPQGGRATAVVSGAPVLAIPAPSTEAGPQGLGGRLVVLGLHRTEVTGVSDAAARKFLSIAWSG